MVSTKENNINSIIKLSEDLSLTIRESECIGYLIQGFSKEKIMEIIKISCFTFEYYLTNIKQKFMCSTLEEVIEKILKMELSEKNEYG